MDGKELDMKYIFKATSHVVTIGSFSIGVMCKDMEYVHTCSYMDLECTFSSQYMCFGTYVYVHVCFTIYLLTHTYAMYTNLHQHHTLTITHLTGLYYDSSMTRE